MTTAQQTWVEYLRSGRFKQGQYALRNGDDTYCCLGVACEAYRDVTGIGDWVLDETLNKYEFVVEHGGVAHEGEANVLPESVVAWLGLASQTGSFDADVDDGDLTDLNDQRRIPFDEIADFVESEPEWTS